MSFFNFRQREDTSPRLRHPAVAGAFYPSHPQTLRQAIESYLAQVLLPDLPGTVRAVVAPHAGYIYSGSVAGYSYKALDLDDQTPQTIFLLGPAHYIPVKGVAVGDFAAYETPLGIIPVDQTVLQDLISKSSLFSSQQQAHIPEHSLEVQLPFLQVRKPLNLTLAPLLLGHAQAAPVAKALLPYLETDAMARVVISSDLSHFHPYEIARTLDSEFLQAVLDFDFETAMRGEACGRIPILVLMYLARELGWRPHLLDYRNSGDTAGDKDRVVGYAAIAYTEK